MTRTTGTPTWMHFGSNDFAASTAFYTGLFGWRFEDAGAEVNHYTMIRTSDATLLGGAMDTSGMTCPDDGSEIPSSWDTYLAVEDIDARIARATEHGATVLMGPADAGPAGRFAMVSDPTGAMIGLWQAGDTAGYEFTGDPGSPVWFELMTTDFAKAKEFYTAVFDAEFVPMPGSEDSYVTNGTDADTKFGVCNLKAWGDTDVPSHWRVYFNCESLDPALAKLTELGGRILDGPMDSPFGRLATVTDPQGAMFQLIATSEASGDTPEGTPDCN